MGMDLEFSISYALKGFISGSQPQKNSEYVENFFVGYAFDGY